VSDDAMKIDPETNAMLEGVSRGAKQVISAVERWLKASPDRRVLEERAQSVRRALKRMVDELT
jgi:hypothetical protein